MQLIKKALHGTTGLVGIRVIRTGYGALAWLTENSEFAGRVLGYPHVFEPDAAHRHRWLKELGIRSILDIGAHEGDYAKRIHEILPDAAIVSFEPQPDCFEKLTAVSRTLPRHTVHNLALGASTGTATLHKNEFSQASSLLPVGSGMRRELPFSVQTEPVSVPVETLDSAVAGLALEDNLLVKIDVQGFECEVIKGGLATLRRAKLVIVETTFRPIYEGQPLFGDVYGALTGLGFRYGGSHGRLDSPVDGAPIQEDSIFRRD
jgi:FkbM family methyltransferase